MAIGPFGIGSGELFLCTCSGFAGQMPLVASVGWLWIWELIGLKMRPELECLFISSCHWLKAVLGSISSLVFLVGPAGAEQVSVVRESPQAQSWGIGGGNLSRQSGKWLARRIHRVWGSNHIVDKLFPPSLELFAHSITHWFWRIQWINLSANLGFIFSYNRSL